MQIQHLQLYVLRPEITRHSYPSTQQTTNLIKYRVATVSLPLTMQRTLRILTLPMNYHLNNLYVMSQTVKLLKLLCFSAISLYTQ